LALVTLGAAGQVINTAGGLPTGRINSIRTVSPLGVIWPAANSMRDDVDTAGVPSGRGVGERCEREPRPLIGREAGPENAWYV
jgi:hypothetical protein